MSFLTPKELENLLNKDRPYVDAFCLQEGVEVVDFTLDDSGEFPPQGLMYFFTNNLGGYCSDTIRKSVVRKKSLA